MTTALLIIDMQNFFASMVSGSLRNVTRLSTHFRARGRPQVVTQHGHSRAELTQTPSSSQLVRRWGAEGSIAAGSWEWELMPEIVKLVHVDQAGGGKGGEEETAKAEVEAKTGEAKTGAGKTGEAKTGGAKKAGARNGGEVLLLKNKNTYDAFLNTDLETLLRERGVQRVLVCGVMTDCCCDTTARSAFNRGFETWLVEDACATASRARHEAGVRAFGAAFGEVLKTAEALERLERLE